MIKVNHFNPVVQPESLDLIKLSESNHWMHINSWLPFEMNSFKMATTASWQVNYKNDFKATLTWQVLMLISGFWTTIVIFCKTQILWSEHSY